MLAELPLLIVLAVLPPAGYAWWLRNAERHEREPLPEVARMLAWGATLAFGASFAFELLLGRALGATSLLSAGALGVLSTVVLGPAIEEVAKVSGLALVRNHHHEPEDGFVYGAAAGLGFAATETVLYGGSALLVGGFAMMVAVGLLRALSTAVMHASTSAIAGFGVHGARRTRTRLLCLLLAVALHATYNALLEARWFLSFAGDSLATLAALGLVAAIALAAVAHGLVRRRVRQLDGGTAP